MKIEGKIIFALPISELDNILMFIGDCRSVFQNAYGYRIDDLVVQMPNRIYEALKLRAEYSHGIKYNEDIRDYTIYGLKVAIGYYFEVVVFNTKDDYPTQTLRRYVIKNENDYRLNMFHE